jgi:hypothetical protein
MTRALIVGYAFKINSMDLCFPLVGQGFRYLAGTLRDMTDLFLLASE